MLNPKNTTLRASDEPTMKFARCMAVVDDRTGTAHSMLYLKRFQSGRTDLIGVDLHTLTQTNLNVNMAANPLDSWTAKDRDDQGEMQVSPDGRYLALTSRVQAPTQANQQGSLYDWGTYQIRLYRISQDHQTLTLQATYDLPGQYASGLEFSPTSAYLYYVHTSASNGYSVRRLRLPDLSQDQGIAKGAAEVRRTSHGQLALTMPAHNAVLRLQQPDAGIADVLTGATVWHPTEGFTLLSHLALQPLIIHNQRERFDRTLDQKNYELTDHLGNVRVVVGDRKLSDFTGGGTPDHFRAWVQSRSDYYPFGSLLPGRNYSSDSYRFGFNTQEKVDEINGSVGTHYTAQFWEYDARIGVRWNRDPITMPWHSPYAVLNGNPIAFVDPQGDSPFGFLGKFFRGIGNTLRGDSWSSRTSSRHVGKRNNEKPEGTSNWRGLLNVFRDLKLGAPAGRMVNQGWVGGGSGSFSDLSGNPIDRTATLNPYRELKDMYGTSRVTVTGLRVWGDADNWPTYARMNSINRRGISEPLFASTATQLIATWPGSWWWLAGGDDAPKPPPGAFYFQTGFAPGLNALPTLEAGILPAIFARVQLPVNLIHNLFGAWMGGAFNHKPLWTGDVWKLQFGAYSPNGGSLRYNYEYKARVWQAYRDDDRPWLSRLLYGY